MCASLMCNLDPFCCQSSWDQICVNGAVQNCGIACGPVCACGDGVCDIQCMETAQTCVADCGSMGCVCGDGFCVAGEGETCSSCAQDCGACPTCGNGTCAAPETCSNCPGEPTNWLQTPG